RSWTTMAPRIRAPPRIRLAMRSQDTEFPIGIVVAIREELRAILKRASPAVVDSACGFRFHSAGIAGRKVVLVNSGMGAQRAQRAAESVIVRSNAEFVLAAGFCGGLNDKLKVGDLVVSSFVQSSCNSPGADAGAGVR